MPPFIIHHSSFCIRPSGARPNMMKMAPLARALAADFSIQPLAFSLSLAPSAFCFVLPNSFRPARKSAVVFVRNN